MEEETSISITNEKLILRDHLAADRTALANERTLLAYIRTSFTFIIAGITVIKFFPSPTMYIIGGISIIGGIAILVCGLERYYNIQQHIRKAKGEMVEEHSIWRKFIQHRVYLFASQRNTPLTINKPHL